MSEFSESYHLRTSDQEQAINLIKSSGIKGFSLKPKNGWASFVLDEGEFSPDERIVKSNKLLLLHYVNAEDHGWTFEIFDKNQSLCRYDCSWEDTIVLDLERLNLSIFKNYFSAEIYKKIELLIPQLKITDMDEHFEHETAYDFARAMELPYFEWFSYAGVGNTFSTKENIYAGVIKVS